MKFTDAKIAIVGATGLVGRNILSLMEEREHKPAKLALFASKKSEGRSVKFLGDDLPVSLLPENNIGNFDIAFFAAGSSVSFEWAPRFVSDGAVVIDKSSAFRDDPDCPLVVPQINQKELDNLKKGIIASPNCSTIGFVLAIKPLIDLFGIPKHIVVATYQSVSGAGKEGLEALRFQRLGEDYSGPFGKPIYNNILPAIDELGPDGFYKEETKLMTETRKILGIEDLEITATAVRVPVNIGHSEAVTLFFTREVDLGAAETALKSAPTIIVSDFDDYPTPLEVAKTDDVVVGRIRTHPSDERVLCLFLAFDNLRRGAVTNALDIAELILIKK